MHTLAVFARHNSIGWMFLTVVLGAVLILTGVLPLQLLGVALIAVGIVTPIALTGITTNRSSTPQIRTTKTETIRLWTDTSNQDVTPTPNPPTESSRQKRSERSREEDQSPSAGGGGFFLPGVVFSSPPLTARDQENLDAAAQLVGQFGRQALLSAQVLKDIDATVNIEIPELRPKHLDLPIIIWERMISGQDLGCVADQANITMDEVAEIERRLLEAAQQSQHLHDLQERHSG